MPKEMGQLNKAENPALKMARESLRRAREMDFTSEEKETVMALIAQAKGFEKSEELSKAFNAYQKLLNFLRDKEKYEKEITTYGAFEIRIEQVKVLMKYEEFLAEIYRSIGVKIEPEEIREKFLETISVVKGDVVKFKLNFADFMGDEHETKWRKAIRHLDKQTFPDIGGLKNLQELELSWNYNAHPPADFNSLHQLKKLNISYTAFETSIDLRGLSKLEELVCLQTSHIPSFIGLEKLKKLDISYSNAEKFPDLVGLTNLEELICKQTTQSPSFIGLEKLKKLDISYSLSRKFPDLSGLINLEELRCDCITCFPDLTRLDNLKLFSFQRTVFAKFPFIAHMKKLEVLLCAHDELHELPDLSNFTELKELDCSDNELKELPNFSANKKLKRLVCFNNFLSWLQIKKAAFKLPKGCEIISKKAS